MRNGGAATSTTPNTVKGGGCEDERPGHQAHLVSSHSFSSLSSAQYDKEEGGRKGKTIVDTLGRHDDQTKSLHLASASVAASALASPGQPENLGLKKRPCPSRGSLQRTMSSRGSRRSGSLAFFSSFPVSISRRDEEGRSSRSSSPSLT